MNGWPGLGGTPGRPRGYIPPDQPGVAAGSPGVIRARRVVIIGSDGELLVYNPTAGAGNLIASIGTITSDQYGNNLLVGVVSYGSQTATQISSGFMSFYTGSLAGGWTSVATIQTTSLGGLFIATTTGGIDLSAATSVTIGGSANTGNGSNGGVTSGPSGTVNAFPAAGPNHTHAEVHTHPL